MSDAVQALLRQAVEEASRERIAAARAEGFAAGLAEAQRDLMVRLKQFGLDLVASPLGSGPVLGNASGPGSVAVSPSVDPVRFWSAVEQATREYIKAPAADCVPKARAAREPVEQDGRRSAYRTEARNALVRQEWLLGTPVAQLRPMLARLPGPLLPAELDLSRWAAQLGVKRPEGFNGTRTIRAAPPVAEVPAEMPGEDAAAMTAAAPAGPGAADGVIEPSPPPQEPVEDDDAPVTLAPAGSVRETPGLVRARELLAMGLHISAVRLAVKLTALEVEALLAERAQVAA